jgi:hypothetical protein
VYYYTHVFKRMGIENKRQVEITDISFVLSLCTGAMNFEANNKGTDHEEYSV